MEVFKPAPTSIDFAQNDHAILKFWQDNQIFKKSESRNAGKRSFVFYDGPPGTNGVPHIGHVMQSALKDVWPRFKTMQGFCSVRKAGWDTHGLPVELTAEADLGLKSKKDIEAHGVREFVEHCRNTVLRFRDDWVKMINRVGRFCDLENDYLTMSNDFIQSDWWVMKQAFDKNLLYKDFKIVPYCCRCGTGLSSHEVAQGYKDITDLTITAKFRLIDDPSTAILAWTTTPWTLLGNLALTVGPEIEYSKVQVGNSDGESPETVILATALIEKNKKALGRNYTVTGTVLGKELVGKRYQPLWEPTNWPADGVAHEVVSDDFVSTEDGTGVVHMAMYGADDFRIIKKFGIKRVQHVSADGHVNDTGPEQYRGKFFREEGLDVEIVKDLAARKLLFDKYRYEHSYPHCWRCSTPLMYFARSSWFIQTTAFRDTMLAENDTINWQPPHIQKGRFGKWLENNVDWAVSRDRYWGSPLPIWTSEKDSSKRRAFSSIAELQAAGAYLESSGKPIAGEFDLHLPYIDDVVVKDADGTIFRREAGVLDCWFNAGVMPWGQFGYPAKPGSEKEFEGQFPADFICEAIDQTRGWFYTLVAVSALVTGKTCFKNVICTEHVLDGNGEKISKSKGNVINPFPLFEKFGADAVRWTFYDGDPWQAKRYPTDLPKESLRAVFIPIWNCYSFFVTYANLDGWDPRKSTKTEPSELDRWILSALRTTILEVTEGLESYDVSRSATAISTFVESLSNWYIRRSRRRFWKSENDGDKNAAYTTLYHVLIKLTHLLAPMAPFLSETMYDNLVKSVNPDAAESVHLCDWPAHADLTHEPALEEEIGLIQEAASLARALRVESNLKIRQPLQKLVVIPQNPAIAARLSRHLSSLVEEVNVKEVSVAIDSADFVTMTVKPIWPKLGPRYGKMMKQLGEAIPSIAAADIAALRGGKSVLLNVAGTDVTLEPDDVAILNQAKPGLVAQSGKHVTVALTTELTPELIGEGHARELISVIQRQRKSDNFNISDQIRVLVRGDPAIMAAARDYKDLIAKECLAVDMQIVDDAGVKDASGIDVNGYSAALELSRV